MGGQAGPVQVRADLQADELGHRIGGVDDASRAS